MDLLTALAAALPSSAGASLLLLLISMPLAAWLAQREPNTQRLILALILLPLITSPPVLALMLSPLLELPPLLPRQLGHAGQLLAYAVVQLPAVVLPLYLHMQRRDPALDEALASLGLGCKTRFRHTQLPGLGSTALLALLLGTLYGLGLHSLPELIAARDLGSEPAFGPVLQRRLLLDEAWPWAALVLPIASYLLLLLLLDKLKGKAE